ncbi:MAG: hypothetical protein ABI720_09690, partial [Actinomycetes bacterium]
MPEGPDPHPSNSYAQRDARTRALLARAVRLHGTQAQHVFDEAVLLNGALARALAHQYRGRGIEDEDLEQ